MKQLISSMVGAFIGALVAIVVTVALTWACVALSPSDKSAGSVSIMIIGLLPLGVIVGAIVGLVRGRRRQV